jgi:hypothetical protein
MSFRKRQYGDTTHTAQTKLLTRPVDLPVDIAYISGTLTVAWQGMVHCRLPTLKDFARYERPKLKHQFTNINLLFLASTNSQSPMDHEGIKCVPSLQTS